MFASVGQRTSVAYRGVRAGVRYACCGGSDRWCVGGGRGREGGGPGGSVW